MKNEVEKRTTFQGGLTVGYVRIAHPSNGIALDAAVQKCHNIADENTLKIDILITDDGHSGIDLDRKGMQWICDNMGIIDNVITSSLSRISRKYEQMDLFMGMLEKANTKLYCIEGIFPNVYFEAFKQEEQPSRRAVGIVFTPM